MKIETETTTTTVKKLSLENTCIAEPTLGALPLT